MKILAGICALTLASAFLSCKTVHFDAAPQTDFTLAGPSAAELEAGEKQAAIEEELKTVDVETTVFYIDRPVYSPDPVVEEEMPQASGAAAVIASESSARQIPMTYTGGIMRYPYDDSFTYEIHTRPYRVTDIILEPGEIVLEQPIMSENNVWEVAAGVSRERGLDVQHFFLKPSKTNLATDMIIITDRHVYHLHLKSFPDRHMVMVKWDYPFSSALAVPLVPPSSLAGSPANREKQANAYTREQALVNAAYLSFDYKMTYSLFRKPAWLPQRVYDDGAKTYIQLDETVLHTESPALFNRNDERVNYRVLGSLIVLDELVEKLTLKVGKETVTIEKKKAK